MKILQITTRHVPDDTRIYHKYCCYLNKIYELEYHTLKISDSKLCVPHYVHKSKIRLFIKLLTYRSSIIHFHDPDFIPFAFLLSIFTNNKIIYDVHEDVPQDILYKTWIPPILRYPLAFAVMLIEKGASIFFDGIITATDFINHKFTKFNSSVTTIFNYPIVSKLDNMEESWSSKKRQYCYIGAISKFRCIHEMVKTSNSNYNFILAGSFSDNQLEDEIKSLPEWSNVTYLGKVNTSQRNQILNDSIFGLILLQPTKTYYHALPVKMFEYMERGIPVIASDFPIYYDIIRENDCGILVEPSNSKEIYNHIMYLVDNNADASRMGANGREAVVRKYNWQNEFKKLQSFYQNL